MVDDGSRVVEVKFQVEVTLQVTRHPAAPDAYMSDDTLASLMTDAFIEDAQKDLNASLDGTRTSGTVSRVKQKSQEKVTTFVYNDSSSPGPVSMRSGYPWD